MYYLISFILVFFLFSTEKKNEKSIKMCNPLHCSRFLYLYNKLLRASSIRVGYKRFFKNKSIILISNSCEQ